MNLYDYMGKKILIYGHGGRGDVLLITPFLKNLRYYLGNKTIINMLIEGDGVLKYNPNIDNTFIIKDLDFNVNICNKHDLVISVNFSYNEDACKVLKKVTSFRYGYDIIRKNNLFNLLYGDNVYEFLDEYLPYDCFNNPHHVQSSFNLLDHGNINIMYKDLEFYFPNNKCLDNSIELQTLDFSNTIACTPYGSTDIKNYHKMNVIIKYLIDVKNYNVILFSDNNVDVRESNNLNRDKYINMSGKLNLYEYAYYLSKCKMCVTVSTLSMHIAACFKIPVLEICFINKKLLHTGYPSMWSPWNTRCITVYNDTDTQADNIPIEKIIESFNKLESITNVC